jgi:tetratricopeptide (TPR) repeat protein
VKRTYLLQNLAVHLYEARQNERLFLLMHNESFLSEQLSTLRTDGRIAARTVGIGLRAASDIDRADQMAEALLILARLEQEQPKESPLTAVRNESFERAWALVETYSDIDALLWGLLIAWEQQERHDVVGAQETLRRLRARGASSATEWKGGFSAYLLSVLWPMSEEHCAALGAMVLNDIDWFNVCRYLAEQQHFQSAIQAARSISEPQKQARALRLVVNKQAEGGRIEAALNTAQLLAHDPAEQDLALRFIILEAGSGGLLPEALNVIDSIESPPLQAEYLRELIVVHTDVGLSAPLLIKKIAGFDQAAWQIELLTTLCQYQVNQGSPDLALHTAQSIASDPHRVEVQAMIALAAARLGAIAIVQTQLPYVERVVGAPVASLTLALAHVYTGNVTEARALYNQVSPGLSEDEQELSAVLLVELLARLGDYPAALELVKSLQHEDIRAEAIPYLAYLQASAGDIDGARHTLLMMPEHEEGYSAWAERLDDLVSGIVHTLVREEQFDRATQLVKASHFHSHYSDKQGRGGSPTSDELLAKITAAQARKGLFMPAVEVAQLIVSSYDKVEALCEIAILQEAANQHSAAEATLHLALALANEEAETYERRKSLLHAAMAHTKVSSAVMSRQILADVLYTPNRQASRLAFVEAFNRVARASAQRGDLVAVEEAEATAVGFAHDVDNDWVKSDLLTEIARTQIQGRRYDQAMRTVQGAPMLWAEVEARVAIVEASVEDRDIWRADRELVTIEELCAHPTDYLEKWNNFPYVGKARIMLGAALAKVAGFEACQELFQSVLDQDEEYGRAGEKQPGANLAVPELYAVACAHARLGQLDQAMDTANSIQSPDWQALTVAAVAVTLSHQGRTDEALNYFEQALRISESITNDVSKLSVMAVIYSSRERHHSTEAFAETLCQLFDQVKMLETLDLYQSGYLSLDDHSQAISQLATVVAVSGVRAGRAEVTLHELSRDRLYIYTFAVAEALADEKLHADFKWLLNQYTFGTESVLRLCGHLAMLYPEQASAIACVLASYASKLLEPHDRSSMVETHRLRPEFLHYNYRNPIIRQLVEASPRIIDYLYGARSDAVWIEEIGKLQVSAHHRLSELQTIDIEAINIDIPPYLHTLDVIRLIPLSERRRSILLVLWETLEEERQYLVGRAMWKIFHKYMSALRKFERADILANGSTAPSGIVPIEDEVEQRVWRHILTVLLSSLQADADLIV